MERPIFKPAGTPVEELDTPALVVDVALLQRNIETVHSFFTGREVKVRPHIEAHLCPAIAHRQLAVEGTTGGVSVSTAGQAEVFAAEGIRDLFVANEVVTGQKMTRLCAVAHQAKVTVAVDNPRNVTDWSEAAQESGVTINAVVDVDTRLGRCGVQPGRPAVDLAVAVAQAPGLEFAGLMTYEGAIIADDPAEVERESRAAIQQLLDTREAVEAAGLPVSVVSAGGTHNYDIAGSMSGVTEVPAGSYALMDARYIGQREELSVAAKIISTVTSLPEPDMMVLDAGHKANGSDLGLPLADNLPGEVFSLSAEHGRIKLAEPSTPEFDLGDKVWLVPLSAGDCSNVYDYMQVVRDGKLEAVWPVSARGRYR